MVNFKEENLPDAYTITAVIDKEELFKRENTQRFLYAVRDQCVKILTNRFYQELEKVLWDKLFDQKAIKEIWDKECLPYLIKLFFHNLENDLDELKKTKKGD